MVEVIETFARRAMADPVHAERHGIAPMRATPLFDDRPADVAPTQADWLRGAVVALLPGGWRYEIAEGMGGTACLTVFGGGA